MRIDLTGLFINMGREYYIEVCRTTQVLVDIKTSIDNQI